MLVVTNCDTTLRPINVIDTAKNQIHIATTDIALQAHSVKTKHVYTFILQTTSSPWMSSLATFLSSDTFQSH